MQIWDYIKGVVHF